MYHIDRIPNLPGKIMVKTPYYPAFAPAARDLGGRWMSPCWEFDEREESAVMNLVDDIYGWQPGCKLVDVQVTSQALERNAQREAEYLGGRLVCRVFSKNDVRAELGDGVTIVSGSASGGGSAKNFHPYIEPGTVFEVRDFPLPMALRLLDQYPEHVRIVRGYDPAESEQQAEPAESSVLLALTAHRALLMNEIAKIDARIASLRQSTPAGEIDASLRDDD